MDDIQIVCKFCVQKAAKVFQKWLFLERTISFSFQTFIFPHSSRGWEPIRKLWYVMLFASAIIRSLIEAFDHIKRINKFNNSRSLVNIENTLFKIKKTFCSGFFIFVSQSTEKWWSTFNRIERYVAKKRGKTNQNLSLLH